MATAAPAPLPLGSSPHAASVLCEALTLASALSVRAITAGDARATLTKSLPRWREAPGIDPLLGPVRDVVEGRQPDHEAEMALLRLARDLVQPGAPAAPRLLGPDGTTLAELTGAGRVDPGKLEPREAVIEALWTLLGDDPWVKAFIDQAGAFQGPHLAQALFTRLADVAVALGISTFSSEDDRLSTPAVNTIARSRQVGYPGGDEALALTRKLASVLRWNVVASIGDANKRFPGIGGHTTTFASNADVMVVLLLHFFVSGREGRDDRIFLQGHDSPGVYALLYILGLLSEDDYRRFRRTAGYRDEEGHIIIDADKGRGTTSYPHRARRRKSGPEIWEHRSVVMGSGGLGSIYAAKVDQWLEDLGLHKTSGKNRTWVFLGDASMRASEHQADLDVAARDGSLIRHCVFVNLQGLDGLADGTGNGNLMTTLEKRYRAAGWKVFKVYSDSRWDKLFEKDTGGLIARRMAEMADGAVHALQGKDGQFIRENFFGKKGTGKYEDQEPNPELLALVEDLTDNDLKRLGWGGHDYVKIYNALREADAHEGPALILFRCVKGQGLGRHAGSMKAHAVKKQTHADLVEIRDELNAPFSDGELGDKDHPRFPLWTPGPGSDVVQFFEAHRARLGGPPFQRPVIESAPIAFDAKAQEAIFGFWRGKDSGSAISTTVALHIWRALMNHPTLGRYFTLVAMDELNTFGADNLATVMGYYDRRGQLYEPADADNPQQAFTESKRGRIFQVGINEPAGMALFNALATLHSRYGIPVVPALIGYSKFLTPYVPSWIWGAGDVGARGFLFAATAGKTPLFGEGEEHADGESTLIAHTFPKMHTYDLAFPFDIATIVEHGIDRMHGPERQSDRVFQLMMYNEAFPILGRPSGVTDEDIVRGMYLFSQGRPDLKTRPHVNLLSSGAILFEALRAKAILEDRFGVGAATWNMTSISEVAREGYAVRHWNIHNPDQPKRPLATRLLEGSPGPVIAATDWHRAYADLIAGLVPGGLTSLGTDGYGFSGPRDLLRRLYGTDAESQVVAALSELVMRREGGITAKMVRDFMEENDIDPDRPHPVEIT